jgi:hypothetical protein
MAAMDTSGVLDLFAAPGSAAAGAGATPAAGAAAPAGGAAAPAAAVAAAAAGAVGGKKGGALQELMAAVGELHDDQSQYEGLSVAAFASKLQQQKG